MTSKQHCMEVDKSDTSELSFRFIYHLADQVVSEKV